MTLTAIATATMMGARTWTPLRTPVRTSTAPGAIRRRMTETTAATATITTQAARTLKTTRLMMEIKTITKQSSTPTSMKTKPGCLPRKVLNWKVCRSKVALRALCSCF